MRPQTDFSSAYDVLLHRRLENVSVIIFSWRKDKDGNNVFTLYSVQNNDILNISIYFPNELLNILDMEMVGHGNLIPNTKKERMWDMWFQNHLNRFFNPPTPYKIKQV
jgi:hypothetical protein